MKKLDLSDVKSAALMFRRIEIYINELVEELAKKGIIELEEEDKNE